MHAHPASDTPLAEFYLVLDGEARLTIDGTEHVLGPGDSALAPVGSEHDVLNAGAGPLRLLTVWGPTGSADFSSFGSAAATRTARDATQVTP
jgi:mannose-6-phosphate isomerase-like protein (cupin superfamily)